MANTINDLYLKDVNKVGKTLENDRYFQYLFEMVQAGQTTLQQTHQVLHKVVVHALSDLDAMCNEIIDRLPFQATWCCKCIIKRYLLEPQYAANRFA